MSERLIRGDVINGYLKFVQKSWGSDGIASCRKAAGIAALSIQPKEYYSNDHMVKVLKWIGREHGMDKVRQAGFFTVQNLGILAYLVRFLDMKSMLAKAEERYPQAYSFGKVDIYFEPYGARARFTDFSECPENCAGWLGAIEAMLAMTKTKGTVEETTCQVAGGPFCEYVIRWK